MSIFVHVHHFVEPQAADDPVKSAQQEIQDLEEILPDIRSKVRIPPKCLGRVGLNCNLTKKLGCYIHKLFFPQ